MFLVVTVLQARDHHLDRDHRIVDQQAEGDDEGAPRNSLKVDAEALHRHEHRGEYQRDSEGHHGARSQTETDQADCKNDRDRLPQRLHEIIYCMLDGHGLVGDERRFDPDRQVRRDLSHRLRDVASEGQDVAAFADRDGEPDAVMSIDAEHRLGGIGGPARDAGDVVQANDPTFFATKLTARTSSSDRNAPETRTRIFSSAVCTTPGGVTAFWARSAAISSERSIPRPANCAVENST